MIGENIGVLPGKGRGDGLRVSALEEEEHSVTQGDRGIENGSARVLPNQFARLRIRGEKQVAGHPGDLVGGVLLVPLAVIPQIGRSRLHTTPDEEPSLGGHVAPVPSLLAGGRNRVAARPRARLGINPHAMTPVSHKEPVPGGRHVGTVAGDVCSANFRTRERPQDGTVVGIQAEQDPFSLNHQSPIDAQRSRIAIAAIGHRPGARVAPPSHLKVAANQIILTTRGIVGAAILMSPIARTHQTTADPSVPISPAGHRTPLSHVGTHHPTSPRFGLAAGDFGHKCAAHRPQHAVHFGGQHFWRST